MEIDNNGRFLKEQLDRIEKKLDTLIKQDESKDKFKKTRDKFWEEISKSIG